jgi:hypothetical protein
MCKFDARKSPVTLYVPIGYVFQEELCVVSFNG